MNNKINVSDYKENHVQPQNNIQSSQNNIQSPQNINVMGDSFKNIELQKSLLDMNKSLRTDIKLSVAIFKQKNNFEYNYINHNIKNAF